jgi:hypothetical protein
MLGGEGLIRGSRLRFMVQVITLEEGKVRGLTRPFQGLAEPFDGALEQSPDPFPPEERVRVALIGEADPFERNGFGAPASLEPRLRGVQVREEAVEAGAQEGPEP